MKTTLSNIKTNHTNNDYSIWKIFVKHEKIYSFK